ncbi:MAG TPA: hypothetical protein VK203_18805 [Nostocaceae cyanobacterium]|nr:hypothetical protein [Nostocaceae cyanobacterium]
MDEKILIWQRFCEHYISNHIGVELFKVNQNNVVSIKQYGIDSRLILERSENMENYLICEVEKVLQDFDEKTDVYEGLIYIMYKVRGNLIIPLYIGKSEKYGKSNNLSNNIKGISRGKRDKSKFCRWGDGYEYHIGDLSAVVCPNHPKNRIYRKYQRWADSLFQEYPSYEPKLKENIYFWIKAWEKGNIGIFNEFGGTPLTALEYQLISVAAILFPDELLNQEGVNRGQNYIWFILFNIYSLTLSQYLLTKV